MSVYVVSMGLAVAACLWARRKGDAAWKVFAGTAACIAVLAVMEAVQR